MFSLDTRIPGLYLTLAEPKHAKELFNLVDSNRAYLRRWLPWLDHNTQADDSLNFLQNCQASYAAQSQLNTLIYFQNTLVGTCGFNSINHVNHEADIGYWLGERFSGQGWMTAAVEKIIEVGFTDYGLNRQLIRAMTDNQASRSIAKRLKFTHEGTLREAAFHYGEYKDLEQYSLLKSDWAG